MLASLVINRAIRNLIILGVALSTLNKTSRSIIIVIKLFSPTQCAVTRKETLTAAGNNILNLNEYQTKCIASICVDPL